VHILKMQYFRHDADRSPLERVALNATEQPPLHPVYRDFADVYRQLGRFLDDV